MLINFLLPPLGRASPCTHFCAWGAQGLSVTVTWLLSTAARQKASRLAGLSRSTWINLQPTNQTLLPFSAKCASSKICPRIARAKSTMMILKIVRQVSKRYPNAVQPARRSTPAWFCRAKPIAELQPYQTREPRGLPPSGGKTRLICMSLERPARPWRAVRGAGL